MPIAELMIMLQAGTRKRLSFAKNAGNSPVRASE